MGTMFFRFMSVLGIIPGIGGISQSVGGYVVSRCADPNLTEEDFQQLAADVSKEGYELTYI